MTDTRIAIIGSCVSRDTCEFLPHSEVTCYVARQSVISALHPVGAARYSADELESAFQAKMFTGDMIADAVSRVTAAETDVILIDLIDERRGVWAFPDGSYLTNSVEAYRAGIEQLAPADGARLIAFGTDEHFDLWRRGFAQVMGELQALSAPLIFIDIDWAEAPEGAPEPRGLRSLLGRTLRRRQRGLREMRRTIRRGDSVGAAVRALFHPPTTATETLASEAREANGTFRRYREIAASYFAQDHIVRRTAGQLRMGNEHRWGQAPYHYRDADYTSIAAQIARTVQRGDR